MQVTVMSDMTTAARDGYETLALERLAELARSANERIALEAARTLLAHLRLTSPQRHGDTENGNRRFTQIGADLGPDRGGAREVSPLDVSAEENLRSSASIGGSQDPDVEKAREHVLAAMDRCAGLLDHENPFVALRAAREILQHWRHLCRERFRWVTWSEVRERRAEVRAEREKKARSAAACARVAALGGQLAGIREAWDREEGYADDWDALDAAGTGTGSPERSEGSGDCPRTEEEERYASPDQDGPEERGPP